MNRLAAGIGFGLGTGLVLIVFIRELSDGAEKLRLAEQRREEDEWRRFLQKWEQAA